MERDWRDDRIAELEATLVAKDARIALEEKIGKTRIINPGALFRIYPYTIALLDAEKDKVEFIEIKK